MKFSVDVFDLEKTKKFEILIVPIFAKEKNANLEIPNGIFDDLEDVNHQFSLQSFDAKEGQFCFIYSSYHQKNSILFVGLGKSKEKIDYRNLFASIFQFIKNWKLKNISCFLHWIEGAQDFDFLSKEGVEGFELGSYQYNSYKKGSKFMIQNVCFLLKKEIQNKVVDFEKGLKKGSLYSKAVFHTRNLVNAPPNDLHPEILAQDAQSIAKQSRGFIKCQIFDEKELKKMGANGILGVSCGSQHPAIFVHLTYKPKKETLNSIALVGKGVTFDSGGISLKPSDSMVTMKCDMAGAASVLGVFSQLVDLKPQCVVHGIFPAVENMPSGNALKPGDVIKMMNGKTVEIFNTDAEGRLILADALVYAEKLKPTYMIDLATLTGACMVALGDEITGLMGNNEELIRKILYSSKIENEKMSELPLEKNYRKFIQSDIADIKNLGGKYGGAITAGLFLQEFVKKTPWVHLDIAGPSFAERDFHSYEKKGATGNPVRSILHFLESFS